jgi:hypothetical protein
MQPGTLRVPSKPNAERPERHSHAERGNDHCGVMSYHCVFPIQRLTAMTAPTDTLLATLEHCDMVEIDGLHAFEFSLDEDDNLHIECLDGRVSKHWEFTPAEVEAATFDPTLQSWLITGSSGEHRLVCMTAFRGGDDEEEANEDV